MSKPANNNLPPSEELPDPAPKYRRASNHRPTLYSARPRLSGISEPLLALNSCAFASAKTEKI